MRVPTRKDRDPMYVGFEEVLEELEQRTGETASGRPLPMVAIVGRPNVGKSTLFNRIVGRRKAIVHDRPGVTRDRNVERAEWDGLEFLCVDTGGYDIEVEDPLIERVVEQARLSIDQADAIIHLMGVHETAHPADQEIVELLRGTQKPVFHAVNKCDRPHLEMEANDFYRYGFERIYPLAAMHGIGIADLLSDVLTAIREIELEPEQVAHAPGLVRLALVGRQNVGKSTMVNQLCGEERVIANSLPGTTRDSIDTVLRLPDGKSVTLIDTAGIRRRGKIERGVEKLSVLSSMMSLRRANVAALVIDGAEGLTAQDAHVAGYCVDAGLPTMILVNKWDIVEKDHRTADEFTRKLEEEWAFISFAPVLYVSATTGQRTQRIVEIAERILANASRRISTAELNKHLEGWVARKQPPVRKNRQPKIRYLTQVATNPPTFALFVNDAELIHFSYQRYLINRLRETWDFEGTPIRLYLRSGKKRKGFQEKF